MKFLARRWFISLAFISGFQISSVHAFAELPKHDIPGGALGCSDASANPGSTHIRYCEFKATEDAAFLLTGSVRFERRLDQWGQTNATLRVSSMSKDSQQRMLSMQCDGGSPSDDEKKIQNATTESLHCILFLKNCVDYLMELFGSASDARLGDFEIGLSRVEGSELRCIYGNMYADCLFSPKKSGYYVFEVSARVKDAVTTQKNDNVTGAKMGGKSGLLQGFAYFGGPIPPEGLTMDAAECARGSPYSEGGQGAFSLPQAYRPRCKVLLASGSVYRLQGIQTNKLATGDSVGVSIIDRP